MCYALFSVPPRNFQFVFLTCAMQEVVDESDGCGGKFNVIVVSDKFEGKPILQRHRLV